MTPRLRGSLGVTQYPGRQVWYLERQLVYVRDGMTIKVPRGFETDLASIPRAVWAVLSPWDEYDRAAVVHDWLYWSQPVTRAEADGIFREAMGVTGVPAWKRQTLYLAVRGFGRFAWDSNAAIGAQGYSRIRTPSSPKVPEWHRH